MKKIDAHNYKMTCWRDSLDHWHCNCVVDLTSPAAKWWAPMRLLELDVDSYVHLLIDKFHAKRLYYYEAIDLFGFSFDTEREAKAFCSYVNKVARKKKFAF
jgi:hypothetical protein